MGDHRALTFQTCAARLKYPKVSLQQMKTLRTKFSPFHFLLAASLMLVASASAGDLTGSPPGNLSNWKALAEGGAQVEVVPEAAATPLLVPQGTNALRITVKQTGRRFGIVCADMGKTKLQTGQWYDVTFNARTDSRKTYALIFSLESPNGKKVAARTTLPEVGRTNWTHYFVALHIRQPASKCRMVIALADTGSISLNDISVVLRQTNETH
jgi:hypothetical protein